MALGVGQTLVSLRRREAAGAAGAARVDGGAAAAPDADAGEQGESATNAGDAAGARGDDAGAEGTAAHAAAPFDARRLYRLADQLEPLFHRIEAAWRTLASLTRRMAGGAASARLHGDIAEKVHLLRAALEDLHHARPVHAFLAVAAGEAIVPEGVDAVACHDALCGMYAAWASRRRMNYQM